MIPFIIGIVLVVYILCNADFENNSCDYDETECRFCHFPCDKRKD